MSLKAFHILFIVLSTLLTAAFGVWGVHDYQVSAKSAHLLLGIASLALTPFLAVYLIRFLNKLKTL